LKHLSEKLSKKSEKATMLSRADARHTLGDLESILHAEVSVREIQGQISQILGPWNAEEPQHFTGTNITEKPTPHQGLLYVGLSYPNISELCCPWLLMNFSYSSLNSLNPNSPSKVSSHFWASH
jgi:hypothetical protein